MQTYILILIGILVLLLIGVVYFGWRKIINLEIESNKNKYDIEALRGLLSKLLDGDEIEMNPSFFKKERPYNIQMNANDLKNRQFGGADADADEDESEVDTLHSSDDEEEIPEDESTVSIENIEDEDSDSDTDSDDEDSDEEDSDEEDSDEDEDDESEEEETTNSEKDEKPESKEEVKENEQEQEVKEISLEKKEDNQELQENDLEDESKTDVKVVEVANKSVKKFPSESLKNYKSGDIVVSKNDGNKYKVIMYKNQKRWKLIDE